LFRLSTRGYRTWEIRSLFCLTSQRGICLDSRNSSHCHLDAGYRPRDCVLPRPAGI
jgi:hypothetical protein